jgi:hypothetical protein
VCRCDPSARQRSKPKSVRLAQPQAGELCDPFLAGGWRLPILARWWCWTLCPPQRPPPLQFLLVPLEDKSTALGQHSQGFLTSFILS